MAAAQFAGSSLASSASPRAASSRRNFLFGRTRSRACTPPALGAGGGRLRRALHALRALYRGLSHHHPWCAWTAASLGSISAAANAASAAIASPPAEPRALWRGRVRCALGSCRRDRRSLPGGARRRMPRVRRGLPPKAPSASVPASGASPIELGRRRVPPAAPASARARRVRSTRACAIPSLRRAQHEHCKSGRAGLSRGFPEIVEGLKKVPGVELHGQSAEGQHRHHHRWGRRGLVGDRLDPGGEPAAQGAGADDRLRIHR